METELGSGKQKVEWFVMNVYASGMKKAEKLLKSEGSLHYYIPKKYASVEVKPNESWCRLFQICYS